MEKIVEVPVAAENPEEGWDDETETQAVVKAFEGGGDVKRRKCCVAALLGFAGWARGFWGRDSHAFLHPHPHPSSLPPSLSAF